MATLIHPATTDCCPAPTGDAGRAVPSGRAVLALVRRAEAVIIRIHDRIETRRDAGRDRHLRAAMSDRTLADLGLPRSE